MLTCLGFLLSRPCSSAPTAAAGSWARNGKSNKFIVVVRTIPNGGLRGRGRRRRDGPKSHWIAEHVSWSGWGSAMQKSSVFSMRGGGKGASGCRLCPLALFFLSLISWPIISITSSRVRVVYGAQTRLRQPSLFLPSLGSRSVASHRLFFFLRSFLLSLLDGTGRTD